MLLPEGKGCPVGGGGVFEALAEVLIEGCCIDGVDIVESFQLLWVENVCIDSDLG